MEAGDRLGAYLLEQLVGEGGLGRVYRARRKPDGSVVALKLLSGERVACLTLK